MTTFICFVIAMAIIYIMRLSTGGFNATESLSFILMIVLLGSHVYLSTRKKAMYGIIVPLLIIVSFYPIYQLTNPTGTTLILLIGLYAISLGCCLYIWYKARKTSD